MKIKITINFMIISNNIFSIYKKNDIKPGIIKPKIKNIILNFIFLFDKYSLLIIVEKQEKPIIKAKISWLVNIQYKIVPRFLQKNNYIFLSLITIILNLKKQKS